MSDNSNSPPPPRPDAGQERGPRFSAAEVAALRQMNPVSAIVGSVVALKRKGREHLGLCPFHAEKTPSFTVNDAKGFYHCFGCGAHGDIFDFIMAVEGVNFAEACLRLGGGARLDPERVKARQDDLRRQRASNAARDRQAKRRAVRRALKIWGESLAIAGTQAEAYLRARGIRIALPATLRFHPSLGYDWDAKARCHRQHYPALVAAVADVNRKITGIHRTWLDPGGRAARLEAADAKQMLGVITGSAVRLTPGQADPPGSGDPPGLEALVVGEGIETCLSVAQALDDDGRGGEWGVWAALATGHLVKLVLPAGCRRVVICADHDRIDPKTGLRPGLAAAEAAAEAYRRQGATARIALPPGAADAEKRDFNDALVDGVVDGALAPPSVAATPPPGGPVHGAGIREEGQ